MSRKRINPIDPKSVDFKAFLRYAFDYYSAIIRLVKRLARVHEISTSEIIEIMKMSPIKYLYDEWTATDYIQRKYVSIKNELKLKGKAEKIVKQAEKEFKEYMKKLKRGEKK